MARWHCIYLHLLISTQCIYLVVYRYAYSMCRVSVWIIGCAGFSVCKVLLEILWYGTVCAATNVALSGNNTLSESHFLLNILESPLLGIDIKFTMCCKNTCLFRTFNFFLQILGENRLIYCVYCLWKLHF